MVRCLRVLRGGRFHRSPSPLQRATLGVGAFLDGSPPGNEPAVSREFPLWQRCAEVVPLPHASESFRASAAGKVGRPSCVETDTVISPCSLRLVRASESKDV